MKYLRYYKISFSLFLLTLLFFMNFNINAQNRQQNQRQRQSTAQTQRNQSNAQRKSPQVNRNQSAAQKSAQAKNAQAKSVQAKKAQAGRANTTVAASTTGAKKAPIVNNKIPRTPLTLTVTDLTVGGGLTGVVTISESKRPPLPNANGEITNKQESDYQKINIKNMPKNIPFYGLRKSQSFKTQGERHYYFIIRQGSNFAMSVGNIADITTDSMAVFRVSQSYIKGDQAMLRIDLLMGRLSVVPHKSTTVAKTTGIVPRGGVVPQGDDKTNLRVVIDSPVSTTYGNSKDFTYDGFFIDVNQGKMVYQAKADGKKYFINKGSHAKMSLQTTSVQKAAFDSVSVSNDFNSFSSVQSLNAEVASYLSADSIGSGDDKLESLVNQAVQNNINRLSNVSVTIG